MLWIQELTYKWGLPIFFFILPWQTRWIIDVVNVSGQPYEFGILSIYVIEIFLLFIVVLMGCINFAKESKLTIRLMLLLFIPIVISFLFVVDIRLAYVQAMHFAVAMLLFLALMDRNVSLKKVIISFTAGLLLPALLGIYQFVLGSSPSSTVLGMSEHFAERLGEAVIELRGGRVLRAYGSFPHPNIFGGYLAVALAGIIGFWNQWKEKSTRIFLGVSGVILSIALLMTFSRSAWLGLLLGLLLGAIVLVYKNTARARLIVVPVALIAIVGILLLTTGRLNMGSEIESRSITERVEQYQEFPQVVGKNWIFGNGIGNYTLAIDERFPNREWWEYQPIHNVPLLIVGEIGLFGLLIIGLWAASIDKINFARFPNREAVTAFMMGNVILIIAFFDHYLWSSWAGLALVVYVMALTVRLGESEN